MKTENNILDKEFHAVEFMRQVRSELSKKYMQDKEQYLEDLREAMKDFKRRQQEAVSQQKSIQSNDV
nr:hypothetical protein [Cytophagales bacterium]